MLGRGRMRLYRADHHTRPMSGSRMARLLVIVPAVLFGYLLAAGDSGFYQIWRRGRQISALRREIDGLEVESARLQEEAALLRNNLGAIERIARERYGMVKANESVYMVYPHPPQEKSKGRR